MDNTYPKLYLGSLAAEHSSKMLSSHGSASNNFSTSNNFYINNTNGFSDGEMFRGSAASSEVSNHVNNGITNGGGVNFMGTNDQNDEVNVDARQKNKKQRFAFQTKSQVDILDDGYRWRKYGQKAVKNNTYPRNYYKCTHQGCNVKKQVQRLDKDETIVMTTYEGMHTHSIQKPSDNFQHILSEMKIFPPY